MLFSQSKKFNSNYAAQIVKIEHFEPHPNPKVERMKIAKVLGSNVLVSMDCDPGTYLYFPPGCVIVPEFLSANNLFRHSELNKDQDKSGYFDNTGRVRMLKLQGFVSEGLVVEWTTIMTWLTSLGQLVEFEFPNECAFDTVEGQLLCKKYVVHNTPGQGGGKTKPIKKAKESRVINEQFRFHYETEKLKNCPWVIKPNTLIHISSKWHGTSGISAYVLCKKRTPWYYNLLNSIPGINMEYTGTDYDYLWSSRKVIKNAYYNEDVTDGFYGVDIWGIAHKVLEPYLTKGLTLYYEIVGYLPTGAPIQAMGGIPYDYGYEVPAEDSIYTYNKHFGIRIYRITYTNPDGKVYEFTARQVHNWCNNNGLKAVVQYWYGTAEQLYSRPLDITEKDFGGWFLDQLTHDKSFFMEELSPECNNKVWHEGVVIRLEDEDKAYKVKCLKFLDKELADLDKGQSNIEDDQCQE